MSRLSRQYGSDSTTSTHGRRRGSPPRCCRSRPRCPSPATTPTVWAMASHPPTAPRWRLGTWSGTVAVIAASIAFSDGLGERPAERHHHDRLRLREHQHRDDAADQSAEHPRQPAADAQHGPVGERTPDRVEHRRDRGPDEEHQRERGLLVRRVDRLRLLREQHLDGTEEARPDADADQREPEHPDPADRAGRLGEGAVELVAHPRLAAISSAYQSKERFGVRTRVS